MTGGPIANPFDAFDDELQAELTEGPRPGLAERFTINMEAAYRRGTLLGALRDASDASLPPEDRSRSESRQRFDERYEAFPQWETPLEGLVAFGGQLAGGAWAPENLLPIGAGARLTTALGGKVTGLAARVLAGATDAALANAAIDAGIQAVELGAGLRDEFSPMQLATSVAVGAVAGGAVGAVSRAAAAPIEETLGEKYTRQYKAREGVEAAPVPPPSMPDRVEEVAPPSTSAVQPLEANADIKPDADGTAGVHLFDPRALQVDAERFQFKSGGDAEGVTDALQSVTSWKKERSNQLIVWQAADGGLFVVDGHQLR